MNVICCCSVQSIWYIWAAVVILHCLHRINEIPSAGEHRRQGNQKSVSSGGCMFDSSCLTKKPGVKET